MPKPETRARQSQPYWVTPGSPRIDWIRERIEEDHARESGEEAGDGDVERGARGRRRWWRRQVVIETGPDARFLIEPAAHADRHAGGDHSAAACAPAGLGSRLGSPRLPPPAAGSSLKRASASLTSGFCSRRPTARSRHPSRGEARTCREGRVPAAGSAGRHGWAASCRNRETRGCRHRTRRRVSTRSWHPSPRRRSDGRTSGTSSASPERRNPGGSEVTPHFWHRMVRGMISGRRVSRSRFYASFRPPQGSTCGGGEPQVRLQQAGHSIYRCRAVAEPGKACSRAVSLNQGPSRPVAFAACTRRTPRFSSSLRADNQTSS